jgi:transcriptional regulator with XRE-family HTH domain
MFTQEKLAALAGLHPTYLGGIERGERNPALENLAAIAAALAVEVCELFLFDGPCPDRFLGPAVGDLMGSPRRLGEAGIGPAA